MEYTDEVLIRAMNKHKAGQQGDIYSGVFIREEVFEFERQKLFQEKMSIMLPKKFLDMPLELAKMKYPMEQRPQIIKTNEIGDINFTFSLLEEKLENGVCVPLSEIRTSSVWYAQEEFYQKTRSRYFI